MHQFMKDIAEWMIDKEAEYASSGRIPVEQIDRQIDALRERRERYQAECEDNLQEIDRILVRLNAMRGHDAHGCTRYASVLRPEDHPSLAEQKFGDYDHEVGDIDPVQAFARRLPQVGE